jgi:hypothetical protein
MAKPQVTMKFLRQLLERCLNHQLNLAFFLPESDTRNPTWSELTSFATEVYAMAIHDVLAAMGGDTTALDEVHSDEGRLCFRLEDRELLLEKLAEFERAHAAERNSEE